MSGTQFGRAFTQRAEAVVSCAEEEARRRYNQPYVGTEHLLLALLQQPDTIACRVLADLGVDAGKIEEHVEVIMTRGDTRDLNPPGLTPRARKVIALAMREARGARSSPTTTGHLLLGMLAEGEGIAASVLQHEGLSLERTREEVVRALETQEEP